MREAQRLGHRIFAGEMGAKIFILNEGLDGDAPTVESLSAGSH